MKRVVFTVLTDIDPFKREHSSPFKVDCFYLTELEYDFPEGIDWSLVPEDLSPLETDEVKRDVNAMKGICMRARFNNQDVYVLQTPVDITRRELECILNNRFEDGTLKRFLKEARV